MIPRFETPSPRGQMFTGEISSEALRHLFLDELFEIYEAEKHLIQVLPHMAEASESLELREAFEVHSLEMLNHVRHIEAIAEALKAPLQYKKCEQMRCLLEGAQQVIHQRRESSDSDAALVTEAQKVIHFELAVYNELVAWADLLNHNEVTGLLEETISDKHAARIEFTQIAENLTMMEGNSVFENARTLSSV